MAAKRPEGVGPTGRDLPRQKKGWHSTRGDPLCRLRRHLSLKGGDLLRHTFQGSATRGQIGRVSFV